MHVCVLALQEEGTEVDTVQCLLCYSHLLHFSLFRKKQQGALPWGFFCYFFGKLMECLFPLKENCLRMVPLFDHPQDNKAFPNVPFEPPLAQLCRKTGFLLLSCTAVAVNWVAFWVSVLLNKSFAKHAMPAERIQKLFVNITLRLGLYSFTFLFLLWLLLVPKEQKLSC